MNATEEDNFVTPGEVLGKASELKPGTGAYFSPEDKKVYASLTGFRSVIPPPTGSDDPRPTVEVKGHKAHGPVPEPGVTVIARVTKVMARMTSVDIICVGPKSVREKFTGIIRQQDVRAMEIDKVDMWSSFRCGDIVKALVVSFHTGFIVRYITVRSIFFVLSLDPNLCVFLKMRIELPDPFLSFSLLSLMSSLEKLSLGDARAYHLSTAKNELGVVSAESAAGMNFFLLLCY
ncbi:hypothetical protein ACS0TY_004975 [Phlomoides rotata]